MTSRPSDKPVAFGDTTLKETKPPDLMEIVAPPPPVMSFGDTTTKQERPDLDSPETETMRAGALPVLPLRDDAVTIKDSHKKTMQSPVAIDMPSAPETKVPSTVEIVAPEPEPAPPPAPSRPRVGAPTLASPGIAQAEWDPPAYPNLSPQPPPANAPAPYGSPPYASPAGALPLAGPPLASPPLGSPPPGSPPPGGSAPYAIAQPHTQPPPPTYRIQRTGGGRNLQLVLVLVGGGICLAIFIVGALVFVSRRMIPTATSQPSLSAPVAPAAPSVAASSTSTTATATATTTPTATAVATAAATTPLAIPVEPAPPPVTTSPPLTPTPKGGGAGRGGGKGRRNPSLEGSR